jgi:hypothetical protein
VNSPPTLNFISRKDKHAPMGLYEGTVQHIITGSYMLPNADDKRKFNVSRKKMRTKKGEKKGQGIRKYP